VARCTRTYFSIGKSPAPAHAFSVFSTLCGLTSNLCTRILQPRGNVHKIFSLACLHTGVIVFYKTSVMNQFFLYTLHIIVPYSSSDFLRPPLQKERRKRWDAKQRQSATEELRRLSAFDTVSGPWSFAAACADAEVVQGKDAP
jgi:hypothetical protein